MFGLSTEFITKGKMATVKSKEIESADVSSISSSSEKHLFLSLWLCWSRLLARTDEHLASKEVVY